MVFAFFLRSLRRRSGRKPAFRAKSPRRSFVPRLMVLENRTLPSTFTVTSLADSGSGTLRAGIASGADTILFAPGLHGTIALASELAISSNVIIDGPGGNLLAVSGGGATRVFDISGGNVVLADLTISGGLATSSSPNGSNGGGIYHGGGSLTLLRDVLAGNEADGTAAGDFGYGGGILNAPGATLSVTGSTFTANLATGDGKGRGGAVFNYGTAAIANSIFTANLALGGSVGSSASSSGSGGAIANLGFLAGATLTVTNSAFFDNQAIGGGGIAGAGGAIWNRYAIAPADNSVIITDLVVVQGCTFTDNRAIGGDGSTGAGGFGLGGAILIQSNGASPALGDNATVAALVVANSTFSDNEAIGGIGGGRGIGGGILTNGDLAASTVTSCAFLGNQAVSAGGGLGSRLFASDGLALGGGVCNAFGSSLTVTESLFNGNRAQGGSGSDGWGGGLANVASAFDVANTSAVINSTLFVHNQAIGGAGGNGLGGGLFSGGTADFGSNPAFTLTLTVLNSTLSDNLALGGDGIVGNGGNGLGGGLFNGLGTAEVVPTVLLSNTTITANQALGGAAGSGGVAGQGIGGGIYNTATVFVHNVLVEGNFASSSDDNVFGILIPL
jgi:hypothetical protein